MAKHAPKKYFDEQGNLIIKPYRLIDMAAIYDVGDKTMRRWMKNFPSELGRRECRYYSIRQVEFMIAQFGLPRRINIRVEETQLSNAA